MESTIKVLSWNMGQMIYSSLRQFQFYAEFVNHGKTPEEANHNLAHLIKQLSPHAVCLQEVRQKNYSINYQRQLDQIVGILDYIFKSKYVGFYGGGTNGDENGLEHRAIMIRSDMHYENPQNISTRDNKPAAIAYKLQHPSLWIASTHLDYSDLILRHNQLDAILKWADTKKEPVLLAGDFNMRDNFASKEEKDWHKKAINLLSKDGFNDLSDDIKSTWILPVIKLDYFFGRGLKSTQTKTLVGSKKLMDHHPIYGEFEITQ